MSIAAIWFHSAVVLPDAKDLGAGGGRGELRDFHFSVDEGWEVRESLPGVFSLFREGMAVPVTVGGVGYSYVRVAEKPLEMPETITVPASPEAKRGKR